MSLSGRILQSEHELAALRATFGENWPAVVAKRDEITLFQEQLTREKKSALGQAVRTVSTGSASSAGQAGIGYGRHDRAERHLGSVQQLLHRIQHVAARGRNQSELYEGLLERLSQTNLQRGSELGNIVIAEPGRPNYEIASPKVAYNMGLASLLGLVLGVGAAFLRDFWDNSVSTLEEAQECARLPGLGTVPASKFFVKSMTVPRHCSLRTTDRCALRGQQKCSLRCRLPRFRNRFARSALRFCSHSRIIRCVSLR